MRHLAFCVLGTCLLACVPSISQEPQRNLREQLREAVVLGDTKVVKQLLTQGVRANTRSWPCESTALEQAVMDGKIEIAKLLMKAGDTPDSLFPGDYRALSQAAMRGDTYLLKKLLASDHKENFEICNDDLDVWRILTIATLKEDLPMLHALGKILPFELIWTRLLSFTSRNIRHPLITAIHFKKRKAFECLLHPPFLPEKEYIARHLVDAFSAAIEHGYDDYIIKMFKINSCLIRDFFMYSYNSDLQTNFLKVILKLKPSTLKRLWSGCGPLEPQLIGAGDATKSIEDTFYESNHLIDSPPGLWKFIEKLHLMGSRPSSSHWPVFDFYVDHFTAGRLSAKEFANILRPLGSWPLDNININNDLNYPNDCPSNIPRCIHAIKDINIAKVMIHAQVPIKSWRDQQGRSLLHHAMCWCYDGPTIKQYLLSLINKIGVDINAKDAAGQTALAYVRPLEGFIQFIDHGATTKWPGSPEGHALNRWVINYRNLDNADKSYWPNYKLLQHPKVAPLLNLAAGQDRRTPLTTACELPQNPLSQGWGRCGTDSRPKDPKSLKQWEEERKRAEQEEEKRWQSLRDPLITCLLEAGANANLPDGRGWTPARAAVESQDMVRLRTLIAHPKGLQCSDPEGLLQALTRGSYVSREALLVLLNKQGIDCGQSPISMSTPPPP